MKKVTLAVIGVGGVGKTHAENIKKLNEAELKYVVDVNEEVAKRVAEEFNTNYCTDYTKLLDDPELDAVTICTPHHLHAKIAIDFMKSGKHVLVEKPMARTISECNNMINVARKYNVKLGVVFQHRTNPIAVATKNFLKENGLGNLYRGVLEFATFRSQNYYRSASWRGTWKGEGGGILINQAIHFIDLFQWFIDLRPIRLSAFVNNLLHEIEVEDIASAIIEFENGVQGVMQFSNLDSPSYTRIVIRGEKGVLFYDSKKVTVGLNKPTIPEGLKVLEKWGAPQVSWEEYTYSHLLALEKREKGHLAVIRDFVNAIIEDREPMVNGEEGRKSVEIVNAIILSGVTGKIVTFPLDAQTYDKVIEKLSEAKRIVKIEV